MKRTSLDGKCWNPPGRRQDTKQTTVMATLKSPGPDHGDLREAPPPPKNPWQKNRPTAMNIVAESRNEDFPLPSATTTTTDPLTPGTIAVTPTNTTVSIAGSHRSSSRASSFSTPDVGTISSPPSQIGRNHKKGKRSPSRTSPVVSHVSTYSRDMTHEPLELVQLPELTPELIPTSPLTVPNKDEPDTPSLSGSDRSLTNLDGLWKNPVGADIHVRTSTKSFFVHRDIVTGQSGWFRDNVPPPPSVCVFPPNSRCQPLR